MDAQLIIDRLPSFLQDTDIFLVEAKVVPGKKISVFADRPEGLTIDQCVSISRFLAAELEIVGLDLEIEVSSPGVDSPFRVKEQYKKALGRDIVIHTISSHVYKGRLVSMDENGVVLLPQKGSSRKKNQEPKAELFLPFSEIRTAKEMLNFK